MAVKLKTFKKSICRKGKEMKRKIFKTREREGVSKEKKERKVLKIIRMKISDIKM